MGRLKRVYFDSCSFDELLADDEGVSAFCQFREVKQLELAFSFTNLDEIGVMLGNLDKRKKAEALLSLIKMIARPVMLKPVLELIADSIDDSYPYYRGNYDHHRVGYCIDDILNWSSDHFVAVAARLRSEEKEGKRQFAMYRARIWPELQLKFGASRGDLSKDYTFSEFMKVGKHSFVSLIRVLLPMLSGRKIQTVLDSPTPALNAYLCIVGYDIWAELSDAKTQGLGVRDRRQVVYAPLVDYFVTEERRGLKSMLQVIRFRGTKVMNYKEFSASALDRTE